MTYKNVFYLIKMDLITYTKKYAPSSWRQFFESELTRDVLMQISDVLGSFNYIPNLWAEMNRVSYTNVRVVIILCGCDKSWFVKQVEGECDDYLFWNDQGVLFLRECYFNTEIPGKKEVLVWRPFLMAVLGFIERNAKTNICFVSSGDDVYELLENNISLNRHNIVSITKSSSWKFKTNKNISDVNRFFVKNNLPVIRWGVPTSKEPIPAREPNHETIL